jgi:hypothetical protein
MLEWPSKWCPTLVRAEHGEARSSRTGMPGKGGTHQRCGGCDLGLQASWKPWPMGRWRFPMRGSRRLGRGSLLTFILHGKRSEVTPSCSAYLIEKGGASWWHTCLDGSAPSLVAGACERRE